MAKLVIEVDANGQSLDQLKEKLRGVGLEAKVLSEKELNKLNKGLDAAERQFRRLAASVDPVIAKQLTLERATKNADRALAAGKITQEQHAVVLSKVRERLDNVAGSSYSLKNVLSTLAGQYTGLTAIVAAATAALTASARAAMEAEESTIRLAFAVRMKGEAYGVSTERLQDLAGELQSVTRFEDDAIAKAEAILLRFDSIDGSNIEQITRLTLDFAEATGRDAPSAAEALAKALEAPGENLKALKDAGIDLDAREKELIKTLVESGRAFEAQGLLIDQLEKKIGGLAETMGNTTSGAFTQFKNMIGDLGETVGSGLLAPFDRAIVALQNSGPVGTALASLGTLIDMWRGTKEAAEEAAEPVVKNWNPALQQLRQEVEANKTSHNTWEAAMDAATDKVVKETAEAKKLADEIARIRENLQATSNIEKFDVPIPDPPDFYLTTTGQSVPAAMADQYREYLDLLGQGETLETRINDLVNAGLITREEANAALAASLDLTIKAVEATDELAEEWKRFQEQVEENFIRGVQTALADFFVAVFEGGEDAMANFADALKNLLFQTLAEYLAQWIITQAKMLAASLARIAKEKAAQQAANAAGGGGGGGGMGSYSSLASGAGMVVAAFAVVGAVAALTNAYRQSQEKKTYGTSAGGKVEDGQMYFGWSGKLNETGAKVAAGIQDLLQSFQQATGSFITGLAQASVRIRNDKKAFEATVNGEILGTFKTAEEAIIAAAKKMFLDANLSKALDPIVQQVIQNYQGNDPKQFAEAVSRVQGIMNELSGLSDIEIALRDLPSKSAALASELRSMGVSMGDAQRVAMEYRLQQMQNLRDQITGHQRTAAEEMAERQRQAAMFNAELALMKAELEAKRAELVAKQTFVRADGEIIQLETDLARRGVQERLNIQRAAGMALDAELQMHANYASAVAGIAAVMTDTLSAQIAAIDQILANLPREIDFKEIKINRGGGGGGGGVASGPSKADRRDTVNQTLGDLASELLPALVAQSRDLTERFAELRDEMTALGMETAQLDALEAAHRARLAEQAQQEVGQYTQNPYQQQLAQILRWGIEMRQVYTELGLSLEEVQQAEEARLKTLGEQALAALGGPTAETVAQMQQLAQAIEFLRANAEALGLTAEEVGQAMEEAGSMMAASLIDSLLQFVDNEDARRELEQMRYALEVANIQLQFQMLQALGLLTAEQIALIQGLIDSLPGEAPTLGGSGGGGFSGGTGGGPRTVGGGQDDELERLRRAIDRLREFYEDLYQDEALSPLSLADRYALAAQEYADTLAAAQAGDVEAIEALPDVAAQYLDLASQMFGTSTASYQAIFEQVAQQVADLIGAFEENDNWADLRWQLIQFEWQFNEMNNFLDAIAVNTGDGTFGDDYSSESRVGSDSASSAAAAAFRSTATERATVYRNVPGLPSNVVVYQPIPAGQGADTGRLDRSIERLGTKLEKAMDKLAKAQSSAADQRARAAGGRRP